MPTWVENLLAIVAIWVAAFVTRLIAHALVRRTERSVVRVGSRAEGSPLAPVVTDRLRQRSATLAALTRSVVTVAVFTVATLATLSRLGVNTAALVAGAGLTTAALAFGAQSIVRDVLTGLFMILEDEYGVGDVIDVGHCTGTVERVSLRTTTLRDAQGRLWYVPNGEIRRVANLSQLWVESWFDVPVGLDADVAVASEGLLAAARSVQASALGPAFLADPHVLGVQDVADDRVLLRLVVRTSPGREADVQRAVRAALLDARRSGAVPFPEGGPLHVVLEGGRGEAAAARDPD